MRKSKFNVLDYEGMDFYKVIRGENGKNWIHNDEYFYYQGYENRDGRSWRIVEYLDLYLDPNKLRMKGGDYYYSDNQDHTIYTDDKYSLDEVEEYYIDKYFSGRDKAKYLPMKEVTDATPEGWYYDDTFMTRVV